MSRVFLGDTKRCSKCGEYKPLTEYHRSKARKCGVVPRCKTCTRTTRRKPHAKRLPNEPSRDASTSDSFLAWFGGILSVSGNFAVHRLKQTYKGECIINYEATFILGGRDHELLQFIQQSLGMGTIGQMSAGKARGSYVYRLYGEDIVSLAARMLPYIRGQTARQQATIISRFRPLRTGGDKSDQEQLYNEMIALPSYKRTK